MGVLSTNMNTRFIYPQIAILHNHLRQFARSKNSLTLISAQESPTHLGTAQPRLRLPACLRAFACSSLVPAVPLCDVLLQHRLPPPKKTSPKPSPTSKSTPPRSPNPPSPTPTAPTGPSPPSSATPLPATKQPQLAPHRHRRLHPRQARSQRPHPLPRSRPPHPPPPPHLRPHRPPAHPGRARSPSKHDKSPDAYERQIDRLLASPAFGERYGQYWLDLARFAETDGFEHDYVRPHAWRYRDWVIAALNADLPYDEFIRLQLAGDELAATSGLGLSTPHSGRRLRTEPPPTPKPKLQKAKPPHRPPSPKSPPPSASPAPTCPTSTTRSSAATACSTN